MCVLGKNVDHVFFCALVPFAGGHVEGAALVVGGEIPRIGLAYTLMTGGVLLTLLAEKPAPVCTARNCPRASEESNDCSS